MNFINVLKKNKIFKFMSSVRLAVPLMVVLIVVSAIGTVLESQYNSEYAKLQIYGSTWFLFLLMLLWCNIFCATVSRIPFQKHHIGFVITHIGLLTLLTGSFLTSLYGIDGQLQVTEGRGENRIVLSELELGYNFEDSQTKQSLVMQRKLGALEESSLNHVNTEFSQIFKVEKYIPFARLDRGFETTESAPEQSVAVSFILKSAFFNVSEWLHTSENPEMNMGPATLRLIMDKDEVIKKDSVNNRGIKNKHAEINNKNPKQNKSIKKAAGSIKAHFVVKNSETHKVLKTLSVSEFKKTGLKINGYKILLKNQYLNAVIKDNKVTEAGGENINPALEISIEKETKSKSKSEAIDAVRDIIYARFPEFSLRKDKSLGLDFVYETDLSVSTGAEENLPITEVDANDSRSSESSDPLAKGGNVIEFHVNAQDLKKVRIELYKNKQLVGKEWVVPGQSFKTPWMNITVTVGAIVPKATMHDNVMVVGPEKGKELPPSAILVKLNGSDEKVWFMEGENKQFSINNRPLSIFYGRQIIQLPFRIGLEKFSKIDYPGTETPLSYESLVHVNDKAEAIKISMNEPLKESGFTLYQSSYSLTPGQAPISIFSVNRDPGRAAKYIGSIILAIGVMLFTGMRSRLNKPKKLINN